MILSKTKQKLLSTLLAAGVHIVMKSWKSTTILSEHWWWNTVTDWREMDSALPSNHTLKKRRMKMWRCLDAQVTLSGYP